MAKVLGQQRRLKNLPLPHSPPGDFQEMASENTTGTTAMRAGGSVNATRSVSVVWYVKQHE